MAGRIPQHFIDQLLNRVDIVDLIDGYVPLKKAGANYKANCPFHGEKTPSFTVSPSKQFYHCFGCGVNGTAISFLMNYDHMEFREAIEKLASSAGLEIPVEAHSAQAQPVVRQGVDLYQLMQEVSDYYQQQLRQHKDKDEAVAYLKQRGLSGEIAKRFALGYAPEGWDNLLLSLGGSEARQKALIDTGMLTQNEKQRVYDRFRHRIMFPIQDHRGRIVGFGGRVLDDGEPKYLNSPETPIFHKGSELYGLFAARGGIKAADGVLVVEGYMDVVALAQAGIDNAVATLGTATTAMHLQRLLRHTPNITFSFDGDRAGRAAAGKALQTCLPLMQDGYQISFLFLPDGEDPDSMVRKVGQQQFSQLVADAQPLTDFLIDHLRQQADLSRLDGRAKLAKLARPMIAQLPDGVLRKLVVEKLARLAQLTPQDLLSANEKTRQTGRPRMAKASQPLPMTVIRRIISLLLQHPHLGRELGTDHGLEKLQIRGIELLLQLVEQCQQNEVNTASLLERHRQESHFAALEKLAAHDHLIEAEDLATAFGGLLVQLRGEAAEAELERLLDKARHEGLQPDEKQQLNELLNARKA
ncbi:MAG: DNA primase [Gammaproteobacteria bacterium]|nr:DNA primase [Gammaproteobacteria bacterium]